MISKLAYVHPDAKIGNNVTVEPFACIAGDVVIGDDCWVGPGAVIHDADEAIARTVRMVKEGKVTAITGEEVTIEAHSICVHGDNPDAVEFVRRIRAKLEAEGVTIAPIAQIV